MAQPASPKGILAIRCVGLRRLTHSEARSASNTIMLKTDIRNAGGEWVDKEAVVDGNLVSARKPDDIPAFNKAMIELFSKAQRKQPAA